MPTRRLMIAQAAMALAAGASAPWWAPLMGTGEAEAAAGTFAVAYPEAVWRKRLTPAQFAVLRRSGTERPFSSPLNREHRTGTFACAGCDSGLFASTTKFDSGTGWPSFWQPLGGAVDEVEDHSFGTTRSAVRCSTCGGHLGHVFNDGPQPTGLRYCMNGVAMTFKPAGA